ncbi:MAG: ArsI/CadI family heavy metal resistance metalloenzyme [Pseudomonadota bacterium]
MKRFHLALTVSDLQRSVAFYSTLFGARPSVLEEDYAKWMLDDPRVNLSLSTHGGIKGVDHVGVEAETSEELADLRAALVAAGEPLLDQPEVQCCYAQSSKTWTRDPDGVAWETFQSFGRTAEYGDGERDRARIADETTADTAAAESCC